MEEKWKETEKKEGMRGEKWRGGEERELPYWKQHSLSLMTGLHIRRHQINIIYILKN